MKSVNLYSEEDTTIRDILKALHRSDIKSEFVQGAFAREILEGYDVKYDVDVEDPDAITCAWFVGDYVLILSDGKAWYVYPSGFEGYESSSTYSKAEDALEHMMRRLFERTLEVALERCLG